MLLTGHANLQDAAATINNGEIFRMLIKPVDQETMTGALRDCVAQHQLLVAERGLLEQTLHGSVRPWSMAVADQPERVRPGQPERRVASAILDEVPAEDRWALELAAMFSQLGVVSLPPHVSDKLDTGADLDDAERAMVEQIPIVSQQLISPIPRMAPVAEAIRYSRRGFDGTVHPRTGSPGTLIPFGGRLLRLVQDYDALAGAGALGRGGGSQAGRPRVLYDPTLLAALASSR